MTEIFPIQQPTSVLTGPITAEVDNDEYAIKVFMGSLARKSHHTIRSYEKECHRFLLWLKATKPPAPAMLPLVGVEDINNYLVFLENPRPFSDDFLSAHGWKHQPFRKPLAEASVSHCITVLHQMFAAMRELRAGGDEPYCKFNPVKLAHDGNSGPKDDDEVGQALTPSEWEAVQEAIDTLPRETERDQRHYHRARWIFQLLYRAFLRREEAASLTMGSFEASPEGWSIRLVGKGGKKTKIIATDKLMSELRLYRQTLGLPALPSPGEQRPAIMAITGKEKGVTAQAIYLICGVIYERAAELAKERGDTAAATRLSVATPHWMRHTGITHAMEAGVNPRYVMAQARHSSLNVTARYDHQERRAWRADLGKV